ncbi:hypothetical protein Hanom_Chr17g01589081 [Helianthus anomalus]
MSANDVNQMDEDNVTSFTSTVKTRIVRWQSWRMVEVMWLVWRVNGQEKILLPVSDQSKFKRNALNLPSSLTYKSLMHFHMWILAFHKPTPSLIAILSIFLDALNRCLLPS